MIAAIQHSTGHFCHIGLARDRAARCDRPVAVADAATQPAKQASEPTPYARLSYVCTCLCACVCV